VTQQRSKPFTLDHFRAYTAPMILDSGDPFVLEDFQLEIVEDLLSGVDEMLVSMPESSGKTTLLSSIALYYCDFTPDASVVMAASTRDQALLLLGQARGFVKRTPGLSARFRTYEGYRRIDSKRSGGRIQVYSADAGGGDGVIYNLALVDEVHRHRSLELFRTWRGKNQKRPGGQFVSISTAGEPSSEFEDLRQRARTEAPVIVVNDRHIRAASPDMILHDFALRPDDDCEDLELVKRANPLSTVTVKSLAAKRASPSMTVAHWRRFVCNVATRVDEAAVGEAEWMVAALDFERETGQSCDVGIDIGWKKDATAICPLFTVEAGHLLGTPSILTPPRDGSSLRPEQIYEALEAVHTRNPIQQAVFDPSAGGQLIAAWLEDTLRVRVVEHSQKPEAMALAAERFLEGIRAGTLFHVGDPDLTRHVLNGVTKELPGGKVRFVRPHESRSSTGLNPLREIDALIAAAMVYSVAQSGTNYSGPLLELIW
jgi:phage terminase large subunit-like protein